MRPGRQALYSEQDINCVFGSKAAGSFWIIYPDIAGRQLVRVDRSILVRNLLDSLRPKDHFPT
jgi:hypothetical protein